MDDALDTVRWRDELLQMLYWVRGEGLGETVAPHDLLPFLTIEEHHIRTRLDQLTIDGYVETASGVPGRYQLTAWGVKEGGRRFADEFSGLTGQAHGECNNPNCSCQTLGPGACDAHVPHTH